MFTKNTKKIIISTVIGISLLGGYVYADEFSEVQNRLNIINAPTSGLPASPDANNEKGVVATIIQNLFNADDKIRSVFIDAFSSISGNTDNNITYWNPTTQQFENTNMTYDTSTTTTTVDGDINFEGDIYQSGSLFTGGGKFEDGNPTATEAVYTGGNVGIGTTNPANNLHIVGTSPDVVLIEGNTSNSAGTLGASIELNSNIDTRGQGILMTVRDDTREWYAGTPYTGDGYSIGYDTVAGEAERKTSSKLFVAESGRVGIGTTSPGATLDVVGSVGSTEGYFLDGKTAIGTLGDNIYMHPRVLSNASTTNQDGMYINYNSTGGAAADLRLYANGTTERVRIDATNGNVGIGTTAPAQKLHVNGTIQATNIYNNEIYATSNTRYKYIGGGSSGSAGANILMYGGANATTSVQSDFRFRTNGTNRMAIDGATGNVGIATTAPAQKLHVVGNARITGTIQNSAGQTIRDADGGWVRTYSNTGWYNGTHGGGWYMTDTTYVRAYNGKGVVASSFVYSSDKNLKENIVDLDNSNDILNIQPKRFDWKEVNHSPNEKNDIGVIAQDVEQYFPQFVTTDAQGIKAVDYPKLVVPLIGTVQDQQKEIDNLKEQIAEIKALLK